MNEKTEDKKEEAKAEKPIVTPQPEKKFTLIDQVNEINEKLDLITDKKGLDKKKKFRLKGKAKRNLKRLYKKRKMLVEVISYTKGVSIDVVDVKESFFVYNGIPRYFNESHVFMYKSKYPMVVLPEWDLEPLSNEVPDETAQSARLKFLIGVIESNEVKGTSGFNPKLLIIIGIVGLIALFIFGGGMKMFTGGK